MAFTLSTPAFIDGGAIPATFTCDGADAPPPLSWSEAPAGTRSFALVMEDPDAPGGTFTHWLVCDIPESRASLEMPSPGPGLRNGFGRPGYGGPCPPRGHGSHRYVFRLHALDVPSLVLAGDGREDLEIAMRGHQLATATLMGRYQRAGAP